MTEIIRRDRVRNWRSGATGCSARCVIDSSWTPDGDGVGRTGVPLAASAKTACAGGGMRRGRRRQWPVGDAAPRPRARRRTAICGVVGRSAPRMCGRRPRASAGAISVGAVASAPPRSASAGGPRGQFERDLADVPAVDVRVAVELCPPFGVVGDLVEDVGVVLRPEESEQLVGRTEVAHPAAEAHHQDVVTEVQVQDAVGHHDHRASSVGKQTQLAHDLLVQRRIQPGCRLVQGEQGRLGQQLQRHRGALALAARERVDALLGPRRQPEQLQDLVDRARRCFRDTSSAKRSDAAKRSARRTVSWRCSTSSCGTMPIR